MPYEQTIVLPSKVYTIRLWAGGLQLGYYWDDGKENGNYYNGVIL